MLFLNGAQVFTSFRQQQLLTRLQQQYPVITAVSAHYGYFIDSAVDLSDEECERLICLLPEAKRSELPAADDGLSCWVVPRLGTISPWTSKATDIAHNCELAMIDRIERGIFYRVSGLADDSLLTAFYDPLTESVLLPDDDLAVLFQHPQPQSYRSIDILAHGASALQQANEQLGLALSQHDVDYLLQAFQRLNRNPTDVELMMFAQVNSEHCRHKIFNAEWTIDQQRQTQSLFSMIRHTYAVHPDQVLVAYSDNAAVLKGQKTDYFAIDPNQHHYHFNQEPIHTVLKVETHNHPTAISPFPGAATGSGGEIRDEAATGRGAMTKAGLAGFSVSHLHIPDFAQPWENSIGKPAHLASALDIMLQGPIGAASFNNEFGRPNLCGYFRTLEMMVVGDDGDICRGYHKPIMIAGGIGHIRDSQVNKRSLQQDSLLIVLGGPAMAIGLGGGSASSRANSDHDQALDFASVQRSNPEMQRRVQEVINVCVAMGDHNPIISVHDVGAGGLSNALPELVAGSHCGGCIELRKVPNTEPGMTPLAIWCNEAQERFVLAIDPQSLSLFTDIAERERCPFAVVGNATSEKQLQVHDKQFDNQPIDLPLSLLFDDMELMQRVDQHKALSSTPLNTADIDLADAIKRVLQYPCVADKSFLITIGDRTVGGLVARDQMVGPWQVPVADVAVINHSYHDDQGQALAMGERAPIAIIDQAASARMAVGEVMTNIAAAAIADISHIVLSANWMAAADYPGEGAGLYDAVQSVALELCPALGISIPVGKDSLSMQTVWQDQGQTRRVTSPLSLIVSGSAAVTDVRKTLTPQLQTDGETLLLLIDLGHGANLLGGSCLAQTYNLLGQRPPDVDDPICLRHFFKAVQLLNHNDLLLAYHDRSDGGLLATLCEMSFAGHMGIDIELAPLGDDPIASLFTEALGAVIQIKKQHLETVLNILEKHDLQTCSHVLGRPNHHDHIVFNFNDTQLYQAARHSLHRLWSETSYRLQAMRDNSACAKQQYEQLNDVKDPGLSAKLNFDVNDNVAAPYINKGERPRIAILREQGVNGYMEMAAAFYLAGFDSADVHMSDLLAGRVNLCDFKGMAAGGGFSYGDVLGAGRGWAQSILMHSKVRDQFAEFFHRSDTFSFGACNGCQMLAQLKTLIPGADAWPCFERNRSEQFEARLSLVTVTQSPSILFQGMVGSVMPVPVAHAEGLAVFSDDLQNKTQIALQYVDHYHQATENYPANPNGSPQGITGLTSDDGRVTIMMPHPERVFRAVQHSWHPFEWQEFSPWMRFFRNARVWVD